VIVKEPGSPQPGSYLAFLVRIQTVDPSAFEMPDTPANEAGVLFIFEQKVAYGTKQTLRSGRRSDASSLNEASEKSLKLRVCPSVLHYRWITADLGGNSCAHFLSR
jgi:hypothetical protein